MSGISERAHTFWYDDPWASSDVLLTLLLARGAQHTLRLLLAGVAVYFLRVGWRLQLFTAAFQLGVELRRRLYGRLLLQGPGFFQTSRTGNLMALATNDIDAVEMAAGDGMLAGFDGLLLGAD